MFGKFGGIVIIALSIAIVAGLILRSVPEHPAALSLGISDSKVATEGETKTPAQEATKAVTDAVATKTEEAKQAMSDKLGEAKDVMTDKAEALKSTAMESIKETVTDTVESADAVVSNIKETVETKSK